MTTPLGAQVFQLCEFELPPVIVENSEVASSCCYYEEQQSSYQSHPNSIAADLNMYNSSISSLDNEIKHTDPSSPITLASNNNLPIIFDSTENDISASFLLTHTQYVHHTCNEEQPFNISSLSNPVSLGDLADGSELQYERTQGLGSPYQSPHVLVPMLGPHQISTAYKDECGLTSYIQLRTSIDPMIVPYLTSGSMSAPPFSGDSSTGISREPDLMMGNRLSCQDLESQGDNGLFHPDAMRRIFRSELQAVSSESQHLVHEGARNSTPLATEISSLEDPTFKIGRLSVEERKRKIHKFMKKRNARNFSKKIKYACRKTLADSRPRVRGRFAKNDEQGEIARTNGSKHEYDDTDEDVSLHSNHMPDHQHISGVNSFKCSYPIQSWI